MNTARTFALFASLVVSASLAFAGFQNKAGAALKELAEAMMKAHESGAHKASRSVAEEAARVVIDPEAAEATLREIKAKDPALADQYAESLTSTVNSYRFARLANFTREELAYTIKVAAAQYTKEQLVEELSSVTQIANGVMDMALRQLPRDFEAHPIKSQLDGSIEFALLRHRPQMGERITYDGKSSRFAFSFASPRVVLESASLDLSARIRSYQASVNNPDLAEVARNLRAISARP